MRNGERHIPFLLANLRLELFLDHSPILPSLLQLRLPLILTHHLLNPFLLNPPMTLALPQLRH